jgi:phosphoglycerate dehydrogenase-like enzyme
MLPVTFCVILTFDLSDTSLCERVPMPTAHTLRVHFGYTLSDESLSILRPQIHDNVVWTMGENPPDDAFDILVAGRPSDELLSASSALRAMVIPFAGLPAITSERLQAYPHIAIYNLHHNAPPTAEMALALLLTVAKRIVPADRDFRQHDWTPRYAPLPSVQLRGKRALILGYGAVGRYLAGLLRSLGMTVRAIKRSPSDESDVYTPDALHDLLPEMDALFICTPGTPETEGMIGANEIALMPKGSMLINVGRALTVDQHALYDALKNDHLHGAGQDVWYHYPTDEASRQNTPPADVPLHELDNMVMSPHRAGGGGNADIEVLRMTALADVLNTLARGETPPHRVSLDLGY